MRGTMIIITPDGMHETMALTGAPSLDALQKAVGGSIETVPYFEKIDTDGKWQRCVAFCNEEGKLDGLPANPWATELWRIASLDVISDHLVGPVVIIAGDDALIESL